MNDLHLIAVDDEAFNLSFIESISEELDITVTTFQRAADALEHLLQHPVDILLSDYKMPGMNGVELIRRSKIADPDLLCVMITANSDDEQVKLEALEAGVNDFLGKPLHIPEYRLRIKNLMTIKKSQRLLSDFSHQLAEEVKVATEKLVQREHDTLRVLSNTAEYKDPETASHVARVAHYSRLMARLYGLDDAEQEIIFYASPLHDIGKVGIRDDVLLKPAKLTAEEFEHMKSHPTIGYNILKESQNPFLQAGAIISLEHHEKFDGSGYPRGLKADEIHLYGRITAVADVFDALTSSRPYKKAWSFEEAQTFLIEQRAKHFDPTLIDLFINNIDEVMQIFQRYENASDPDLTAFAKANGIT